MVSSFLQYNRRLTTNRCLVLAFLWAGAAPVLLASCSASRSSTFDAAGAGSATGGDGAGGSAGAGGAGGDPVLVANLVSIRVDPPAATLVSKNGSRPEQAFRVIGSYDDGTTQALDGASFTLDVLASGAIDERSGVFTANGIIGGAAAVTATLPVAEGEPLSAAATIDVAIEHTLVGPGAPSNAQIHFTGALVSDTARAAQIVYPLDGAVMPQNVFPADIQWLNGLPRDLFLVTLQKPHITVKSYVRHWGSGFENDWVVDTQAWRSLAQTDPDEPMTIHVDRWEAASGQAIASRGAVSMTFVKAALTGSVYYWDIDAGRIKRIDGGTGTAVSFMPTPPASPTSGENCVGCHSVSTSGRYMAGRLGGSDNIGAIFDLTLDLTGDPSPTVYPLNSSSIRWWSSSWNPEDTRLVVSTDESGSRAMNIYDPFTGREVPVQGSLPRQIAQPVWSPDGLSIAYVSSVNEWGGAFTSGNISVLPVLGADIVGIPRVIHQGTSLAVGTPGGDADSYPTWTPDSQRIAFAHGTGARSDAPDGRFSALYIMNANGADVVRLDAACGGPGSLDDFQSRFSPFDSGGYFWLSFLSRRDYGNGAAGTRGTSRQQIWVTGIKKTAAPGEDPSAVAFWLPGQSTSSKNISAFWAPRPCREDGESCSVGSECCGGDCRPNTDGELVCTPPPPERCRQLNETCSTSADCCDGRSCVNNVCIDPIPN